MSRPLTTAEFPAFVAAHAAAAVHFDAVWNAAHRERTRRAMRDAEAALGDAAAAGFAEVDCDAEPQLARSLRLANVSAVAYFRHGRLVAALVGSGQHVRARLERVLRGEPIGRDDGTTAAYPPPPPPPSGG